MVDFGGALAIVDNRFKLVIGGAVRRAANGNELRELFDLRADPAERNDLAAKHPEEVTRLSRQLRIWQESVLSSLTGADYRR